MICNLSKVDLSCHDVSADALTEEELLTIKELERQTGLVIVAVKPPQG
ncbi:MAG: hypothetical protein P8013_12980 [Candidatus Sulfobium sp.]